MRFKLVIFDWEGTLVDPAWREIFCFQQAAEELNFPIPAEDAIRAILGLDLPHIIRALFSGLSAGQCAKIQDAYWRHFLSKDAGSAHLYEGVKSLLLLLKAQGCLLAVATGKSRQGLDQDILETGLEDIFDSTRTVDEAPSKPNPQMLFDILDQLHVKPDHAVMVGDAVCDMEMAQSADIHAIAVAYGYLPAQSLQDSSHEALLTELSQLRDYLQ